MRTRWTYRRDPQVYVSLDISNMNRPMVGAYGDESRNHAQLSLSWGNGNSDPVWIIDLRVRVPRLIGERLSY